MVDQRLALGACTPPPPRPPQIAPPQPPPPPPKPTLPPPPPPRKGASGQRLVGEEELVSKPEELPPCQKSTAPTAMKQISPPITMEL